MKITIMVCLSFFLCNNIYSQVIAVPAMDFGRDRGLKVWEVDEVPLFKKCKKEIGGNGLQCFTDQVKMYISENVKYPKEHIKDSIRVTIYVKYKIDKKGKVSDIKIRKISSLELFEKEAFRVIKGMPKLKPALFKGKKVIVESQSAVLFSLTKK